MNNLSVNKKKRRIDTLSGPYTVTVLYLDSNSMWKEPSKIVLISLAMVIVLALLVILGFMIHKNM